MIEKTKFVFQIAGAEDGRRSQAMTCDVDKMIQVLDQVNAEQEEETFFVALACYELDDDEVVTRFDYVTFPIMDTKHAVEIIRTRRDSGQKCSFLPDELQTDLTRTDPDGGDVLHATEQHSEPGTLRQGS